ncbi:hypothetical protein OG21DRAFT_1491587 [Imleria badia]|nr:hypothetical protein OG21DRAFT_1491587 [Imleria badia]
MLSDLEEALALERNALELFPEGHPGRSTSLSYLALYLHSRFKQLRMLSDLEEALALERNALELFPEGHPDRSTSLSNLALFLHSRFKQLGMLSDLEEALELQRNASELLPERHPDRAASLGSLAASLHSRFEQLETLCDPEEALALQRNALQLCPEGHPSDEVDVECILPHPSLRLDERQRIFELRLRKMLDLACSSGLRVPGDPIPSSLPVGVQNTPWTERASIADGDSGSMVASRIGSSTVFRSASSGDPKKIRKIDKIKQKLVEMLREIGFRLSNGRLPWSTLEGDLRKKGYTIVNWPQGVNRERDKGVFGISAEDADKLYDALFVGDHWIRFVRCEESACNDDGVTTLTAASGSDGPREHSHSSGGKQSRFRVTTAAEYPNKRRRV